MLNVGGGTNDKQMMQMSSTDATKSSNKNKENLILLLRTKRNKNEPLRIDRQNRFLMSPNVRNVVLATETFDRYWVLGAPMPIYDSISLSLNLSSHGELVPVYVSLLLYPWVREREKAQEFIKNFVPERQRKQELVCLRESMCGGE